MTVILTGATGGIGCKIAEALCNKEYNVVITGRNEEKLSSLADRLGCVAVPGDISALSFQDELLTKAYECFGSVDCIINCAGIAQHNDFTDTEEKLYDDIMKLNVKAPYFLCQKALPYLKKSDEATIINIASVVAHKGYPYQSVYAASKHALLGFSKSLANEVYKDNIRVHVISPGAVFTEMVALARPDLTPDGMTLPEDIAETVLFLIKMRATNAVIDELQIHRTNKEPFN